MYKFIRNPKRFWKQNFNLFKTLYFNFKVFNFKDALTLPVFLYGHVQLEGIHRGCIVLHQVRQGTIIIGGGWYTEMFGSSVRYRSFLRIKGKIICGVNVTINQGAVISVNENAFIKIGDNVRFNERLTMHSKERIEIGNNVLIGWNTQIVDSDFHYTVNNGKIKYRTKPVLLNQGVWIANGVSIMKGTNIPAFSVVASNSLVNKDFSDCGESCLIGGLPAKLISNDVKWLRLRDSEVDKLFKTPNEIIEYEDIKDELMNKKYHKGENITK